MPVEYNASVQACGVSYKIPEHQPGYPPSYDPAECFESGCSAEQERDWCGCQSPELAENAPPQCSDLPIRYASGEIVLNAADLMIGGYGVPWGHTRSFASRLSENTNLGNGYNWQIKEWTYLVFPDDESVVVMGQATQQLWFEQVGGGYQGKYSIRESLVRDGDVFRLVMLDGAVTEYNATTGVMQRRISPGGNTIEVSGTTDNGFNFTDVERSYTSGGTTTVEQFHYDWDDESAEFPTLDSVTLRRKVNGGAWTNILRVNYTYYGESDAHGAEGDLQTAATQAWDGSAWQDTGPCKKSCVS